MSSAVFGKRMDLSSAPATGSAVDSNLVRLQLERIVASRIFQHAKNDRCFLEYAVGQTLAGCADQIKEYSLGTEVFHRGEGFDPRLDPIVRIQARSLRSRLSQYYETEGKFDSIEITLPKGTYVPVFTLREPSGIENAPLFQEDAAAAIPPVKEPEPVAEAEHRLLEHAQTAPPEDGRESRKTRGGTLRWWKIGGATAALLCAVLLGSYVARARYPRAIPTVDTPSIAILPFENQSDDKADEFFSDGLTDELIDSFARLPGMRVVARTSVYQFKGKSFDVRKIARELNVRNVLEGSVRRYGDRIRITAELEDANSGYTVWSQTYDRDEKDALAIQREISSLIAQTLGLRLEPSVDPAESPMAAVASPGDSQGVPTDAYEDYLRGRYFFDRNSAQGVKAAIGYFQQAIAKAPQFAPAYMGLAHCYVQAGTGVNSLPADEIVPAAIANANKAVALDPKLGEARLDLALAAELTHNWAEADRQFERALELSPGDSLIHRVYSGYLLRRSMLGRALQEAQIGSQLDPVSARASAAVARALYFNGQFDAALEQYQVALQLEPNSGMTHLDLAEMYMWREMYAKGLAELDEAERDLGGAASARLLGLRGYAYGRLGEVNMARQVLGEFNHREEDSSKFASSVYEAYVYIGLGDKDNAFLYLQEAAMTEREMDVLLLNVSPIYSSLRPDPRFEQLRHQLDL